MAHRDLKGDNVLIDDQLRVVIADFGESRHLVDNLKLKYTDRGISKGGYIHGMAPEIYSCKIGVNSELDYNKNDVWAIGNVMYELFVGKYAYEHVVVGSSKDSDRLKLFNCSTQIDRVAEKILRHDVTGRGSVDQLIVMLEECLWNVQSVLVHQSNELLNDWKLKLKVDLALKFDLHRQLTVEDCLLVEFIQRIDQLDFIQLQQQIDQAFL